MRKYLAKHSDITPTLTDENYQPFMFSEIKLQTLVTKFQQSCLFHE